MISDELSDYLGEALQVELNINPIQFPAFGFKGIDAEIKKQQVVFDGTRKEDRQKCCSDETYQVDVPYKKTEDRYRVDLCQTIQLINKKIDEQVSNNKALLQRVIEKQIANDFRNAELQINNYIQKFQEEFDSLLKEREIKEADSDKILSELNIYKKELNQYKKELESIRTSLDTWKK